MGTFLGSGIAYLGKDEIWVRVDYCRHCGARAQLAHYTARKVFKLAGISLLPLGRFRIEDECRICGRRSLVTSAEWTARREQVMGSRRQLLEDKPGDVAGALDFLEAVQRYSCLTDLQEEAPGLAERFAHNSHVLALLGTAYSYFREWEQAEAFFEAAESGFELDCLRALDLLRRGYPSEAEPKLEPIFQERLEAHRDALYLLVEGYQSCGQMEPAARVLERIEATWPAQKADVEHKWFWARNHGRKHLPTLALKRSIPKTPWFAHPVVFFTILPGLFCYALANVWAGQNRELYLVNGTDVPYDLEIGGKRLTLVPGRPEVVTVAEGKIAYKVLDPSVPSGVVEIQTPALYRATQKRTFVLNPDGLAFLHTERAGYADPPPENMDDQFQFYPLQNLHEFPDINLPFEDFPTTIHVRHGWFDSIWGPVTYLRRLEMLDGGPSHLLEYVAANKEAGQLYLESALRISPSQELLDKAEETMQADALLDAASRHLEAQPVETAWHILYQDLSWSGRDLVAEYKERLGQAPEDPELRFLLARVSGDWRSVKPGSPFAQAREARLALARGDFEEAEKLSREQLPALRGVHHASLMALGRYQDLLALPLDDRLRMLTLDASGKKEEAERCVKAATAARKPYLEMELGYARGRSDFESEAEPVWADFYAGRWQKLLPEAGQNRSWTFHLTLYLMSKDKQELARAIDLLAAFPPFSPEFQAAELLRHPGSRALELGLKVDEKRLFLAALCLVDGAHRLDYASLAGKLNFEKSFPYWTIKKVIGEKQ